MSDHQQPSKVQKRGATSTPSLSSKEAKEAKEDQHSSSSSAADSEDALLQWRLLVKEFTLKAVSKTFINLQTNVASKLQDENSVSLEQDLYLLMKDLVSFDFNTIKKLDIIWTSNQNQLEAYKEEYLNKENEIEKTKKEIEKLKIELEEEKQIRKNKEEYEILGGVINSFPSRSETQKEIEQLHGEIESLLNEETSINTKIDLRTKQFQLLLFAIHQLEQTLESETLAEEELQKNWKKRRKIKWNKKLL